MKAYPPLPSPGAGADFGRPLDICIASNDVPGPVRNGGIGTACLHLALTLRDAGHRVTFLYLEESFATGDAPGWEEHYRRMGLGFVHLPGRGRDPGDYCANRTRTTFACYQWLKRRHFDVVHFHERMGIAYYPLLAKRHGLAFEDTLLCVTTHGPVWWSEPGNETYLRDYYYLEVDRLERESVRLADVVISPSAAMLEWLEREGWELPGRVHVQPHAWHGEPQVTVAAPVQGPAAALPVREIVFFGRVEIRKGLDLFCDALDLLCERSAALFAVTFLGKLQHAVRGVDTREYLRARMRAWNVPVRVLSECYSDEALAYLRGEGRLAVMPSHRDNAPLTVMECLLHGVPFVTSDTGGAPEMIHADDRPRTLFPPRAEDLAQTLLGALERGVAPARLSFDLEANRRQWTSWHASAAARTGAAAGAGAGAALPFISVCLPTCERPVLLAQALASLRAQSYRTFEVIVVDDASRSEPERGLLASLEAEVAGAGWKFLRQDERRGPGAARNRAARAAAGEYLLFMDDDNLAKPGELETFARVAARRRGEIYTCVADVFSGPGAPPGDDAPERRMLPLGSCGALGFFECRFGDTNSLVRRDWFLERGGFDERMEIAEDWEFLARAALDGVGIEVLPEALYWYRRTPGTRQDHAAYQRHQSLLRLYQNAVPPSLRGVLAVLLGLTRGDDAPAHLRLSEPLLEPAAEEPGVRAGAVYPAGFPGFGHNTGMTLGEHVLCHHRVHLPGHCIFGPGFRPEAPGPLEVRFFLEPLALFDAAAPLASLDVYDQESGEILAIRHVAPGDLAAGRPHLSLRARGERGQRLEFRVFWHGTCDLLVSKIEVHCAPPAPAGPGTAP